jgi:hypothetical protein
MLNNNLTQEEAKWLVEVFAPKMNGRIDGTRMDQLFVPARTLIQGKPSERPGCGCHFKAYAQMTNSMYSQHEGAIREIAYPKVTTTSRGRKKMQQMPEDTTSK